MSDAGHEGCVSLDSVREHRLIVEALRSGRVRDAQRALEDHLKADRRRTRALLHAYKRAPRSPVTAPPTRRRRLSA